MRAVLFLLAIQTQTPADSTAYLDRGAAALVRRARERRATAEETITAYQAVVRERISLGLRALRRDRRFYQREMAARIAWHRDGPDTVTMLGARESIPVVYVGTRLPDNLRGDASDLAFEPGDERLGVGIGDSEFVYDPLANGSESRYRFRSGDTTIITMQDGTTIRLLELRIIPRQDDFHLLTGSFWLEDGHAALVQAVFRPARVWDLERDLDPREDPDVNDIPGFLKPIRGEVRYITIEYALIEGKWWLPRLIAVDVVASAGSLLAAPLKYERVFSEFTVATGPPLPLEREPPPQSTDSVVADSADLTDCPRTHRRCRRAVVIVPDDSLSLVTSPLLPPSLDDAGPYLSEAEARELGRVIGRFPVTPWQVHAPRLRLGPGGAGLVRYNRIEALSLGARLELDLGRLRMDALARVGAADGWPNLELGATRETPELTIRLAGYRRLVAANPDTRPLGIGNSLAALVLGRDDGEYFRAWGGEVVVRPLPTAPRSYEWRVFLEWQRAATKGTEVSLPHVVRSAHEFRTNLTASPERALGTSLVMRGSRGISTRGTTVGAELGMDAAMGTFDYARVSLTTRLTAPLPARLLGAVEVAAGATGGDAPAQGRFFLGGPATLRGYAGGTLAGPDFWRARLEIANALPVARVAVFGDAGWTGTGMDLATGRPLLAVGVGASLLDGIVRVDLARALRSPTGWRMDFYVDGIL